MFEIFSRWAGIDIAELRFRSELADGFVPRSISEVLVRAALLATGFLFVAGLGSASATPVTTFSGTPTGLTFTIESVTQAASDLDLTDGTNDTYDILLRLTTSTAYVDSSTYTGTDYLKTVAIDVGGTYFAGLLVSDTAPGTWNFGGLDVGTNGNGACGGSDDGSLCADNDEAAPNLQLDANGSYDWLFRVDLGALHAPGQFASTTGLAFAIAGISTNPAGKPQWENAAALTASGGTLQPAGTGNDGLSAVPEPASLFLFGTGAAVLARMKRRTKSGTK